MTRKTTVLIADRYLLDSQLLERRLGRDFSAAACAPEALRGVDLAATGLVLLDVATEATIFDTVSARATRVGLLYDDVDTLLRARASTAAVRLVVSRDDPMDHLVSAMADVLDGADRSAIAVARSSSDRPRLSRREHEVLRLMAQGLGNRGIADELSISPHTVRTHVQALLTKLDRRNRVSAVGAARAAGLLST